MEGDPDARESHKIERTRLCTMLKDYKKNESCMFICTLVLHEISKTKPHTDRPSHISDVIRQVSLHESSLSELS